MQNKGYARLTMIKQPVRLYLSVTVQFPNVALQIQIWHILEQLN